MTEVLAAELVGRLILATDSRIGVWDAQGEYRPLSTPGQKLFLCVRAAVLTHGEGVNVPATIDLRLSGTADFAQALYFMKDMTRVDPRVRAIVAGLDKSDTPSIFDVAQGIEHRQVAELGQGPQLWARGVFQQPTPLASVDDDQAIVDQMLAILRCQASMHASVGPPYCFAIISTAETKSWIET